jgi:hypothetical protein
MPAKPDAPEGMVCRSAAKLKILDLSMDWKVLTRPLIARLQTTV